MGEVQGLFLEDPYKKLLDRYRLQLYHKIVIENGNIDTMEGKTLLETGCGRGGGLDYLAIKLKPQYAIGVDMSPTQVTLNQFMIQIDCLLQEDLASET